MPCIMILNHNSTVMSPVESGFIHSNLIDHFINEYEMNCYMFISLLWRDHICGVMGDQVKHDYKIGN
jgi:hypothetical protein